MPVTSRPRVDPDPASSRGITQTFSTQPRILGLRRMIRPTMPASRASLRTGHDARGSQPSGHTATLRPDPASRLTRIATLMKRGQKLGLQSADLFLRKRHGRRNSSKLEVLRRPLEPAEPRGRFRLRL